jgi:hypothetical protein
MGADLIEAGLNEGAAGLALGDYGDCVFLRRRMPTLGVAANSA